MIQLKYNLLKLFVLFLNLVVSFDLSVPTWAEFALIVFFSENTTQVLVRAKCVLNQARSQTQRPEARQANQIIKPQQQHPPSNKQQKQEQNNGISQRKNPKPHRNIMNYFFQTEPRKWQRKYQQATRKTVQIDLFSQQQ